MGIWLIIWRYELPFLAILWPNLNIFGFFQNGKASSPTKTDGNAPQMILPQKKPMQPPHVSAQDGVRSDLLKAIRDGKKSFFLLFFGKKIFNSTKLSPESSEIYVSIHSQLFWQGRKKSFVSRRTCFRISISRKKILFQVLLWRKWNNVKRPKRKR